MALAEREPVSLQALLTRELEQQRDRLLTELANPLQGRSLDHWATTRSAVLRCAAILSEALGNTPLVADPATDIDRLAEGLAALQSAHQVWEMFRRLIAQRTGEVGEFLRVADDQIGAILEASALAAVHEEASEVLVFLSVRPSPFVRPRGTEFLPDGLDATGQKRFKDVLSALPVALVGLPWRDVGDLGALAALAHEAGHVLDEELGLSERIGAAVGDTGPWKRHGPEAFADVVGCLEGGSAFTTGLVCALAGAPVWAASEAGAHPSPRVRVKLCQQVRPHDQVLQDFIDAYPVSLQNEHQRMEQAVAMAPGLVGLAEEVLAAPPDTTALGAAITKLRAGESEWPQAVDSRQIVTAIHGAELDHAAQRRFAKGWPGLRKPTERSSSLIPAGQGLTSLPAKARAADEARTQRLVQIFQPGGP